MNKNEEIFISVVIPVYKSEDCLNELYKRLNEVLNDITSCFEIILINDASPENDWNIIKELSRNDNRVKGISFSRNFGQHYALSAGLEMSRGKWVITMDCDLQDDPIYIKSLIKEAQRGYDVVHTRRIGRKDGFITKLTSQYFYKCFELFSGLKYEPNIGTYCIMSRKVVDTFCKMPERHRYFGGLLQWMGYKTTFIEINTNERHSGNSSYTLSKRMKLGINAILSFSDKPLIIMVYFGLIITCISSIFAFIVFYQRLSGKIAEIGYASLIISLYFLNGVLLISLGLIGIYIGRIYTEIKGRPYYIIGETTNEKK